MNILITGAAGFIGFNFAKNLLDLNHTVYGVDNFDNYYSTKFKNKRINILRSKKKFYFKKIDIVNFNQISNFIKSKKIDIIIHLAAQAGVRYSLKNPNKYLDVNIRGFTNLIKAIENKKIKKFIYASSSSVYGESRRFPLKENFELNPKNIYGLSKKINEQIAEQYSKIYKTKFIGLRFFTLFGEWGRPDMFMLKLFKASKLKKTLFINNFGNHMRDFTYIGDVCKIINLLIKKRVNSHEIFNICSNNPINILKIVKRFKKNNYLKTSLIKLHKADVIKTHGDNNKIKKFLNFNRFSNFYEKFDSTFKWYLEKKIFKL